MNGTTFKADIKYWLRQDNTVNHLMIINIAVFLIVGILRLLGTLQLPFAAGAWAFLVDNLVMHADRTLLFKPWGAVTYMFFHIGVFHILFNMLTFFWFGNLFRSELGNRRVLPLYLLSGLFGAGMYLLFYYLLPPTPYLGGPLLGASGATMAFLIASATLMPNMEISILVAHFKLKWLAIGVLVLNLISIPDGNVGGILAHLGGALFGFAYVRILKSTGTDLCAPLMQLFDGLNHLFSRRKTTTRTFKPKKSPLRVVRNAPDPSHASRLDQLLDKISEKGYNSLTSEEKQWLRQYSNEK
ncbi:rhomboid family intramembrane serine protease [Chitinophaga sp.]|uniref:rhomboid family protein n=1 Tax=Chitinophaga sp. TaxID=1869181 RepID=UPI0026314C73|nr:rhomboid family intramembrane serine protease [uncultured Chitinophaga sp.]